MTHFPDILLKRDTVLLAFVVTGIANTLATDFGASSEKTLLSVLSVIAFPLVAWFAHKRQLLAIWCTVLLLIVTGSGFLYDAFSGLKQGADVSYAVMLLKTVAGIYLTWGALLLHRERHIRD
ncbi:hypothetical protein GM415_06445 [Pseudodesulfovibrio cashew]|uniref:Uncharacterized protein n=1 Tax=Pseudodesulfovibrio cashew TaxID=2678688 RepID=A0A6I6JQ45_9BACT|nr:hypothetical protein [Pseudodesulfovibrio cashew]QGY39774.1 hypothetical protein GM415_06445 [Pseudodesulfovibrio cashew]